MTNKRILIIDDEPDLVKLTSFRLRKAGYTVSTAENGASGLTLARSEKPNLILLDLNLPEMSGYDVCRALKSDEELRHIPVIVVSASSETIKEKTREIGAEGYMIKPFEVQELFQKIRHYFKEDSR